MARSSSVKRLVVVLISNRLSSSRVTLPCQRYVDATRGTALTQAASRASTSAAASVSASSGEAQVVSTSNADVPVVTIVPFEVGRRLTLDRKDSGHRSAVS